jgi:hypothetical protein
LVAFVLCPPRDQPGLTDDGFAHDEDEC